MADDAPKVLVLVPSYNHDRFIEARINSILNQSYGCIDVVIIDDHSTDQTARILSGIDDPRVSITIRPENSGSPFTAWTDAKQLLRDRKYKYLWIAESDDKADHEFLRNAVDALEKSSDVSLYYCHSWSIDDSDLIIGHSINYLNKYFQDRDWSNDFVISGEEFIKSCLILGMAIPNMSSALIRAEAFCTAMQPDLSKLKLAGDWVFAIGLAKTGAVAFGARDGNYFRHHARTSRRETRLARTVYEHMLATRKAYESSHVERSTYTKQMAIWGSMYRHERVNLTEFIKIGLKISPINTLRFAVWANR